MRELEYLTLQQTQFALKQHLSEEVGLSIDVESYIDRYLIPGVVCEFRTKIWSHQLPPETMVETDEIKVEEWKSAWQLWKFNHWDSWWFTYLGFLFFCSAPETVKKTYKATVSFNLDKRTLFPDYNYPATLGNPYHNVVMTPPKWVWTSHE